MLIHSENRDLTQIVIGAAMKVLNTLNPGLDEKLYERALVTASTESHEIILCTQDRTLLVASVLASFGVFSCIGCLRRQLAAINLNL